MISATHRVTPDILDRLSAKTTNLSNVKSSFSNELAELARSNASEKKIAGQASGGSQNFAATPATVKNSVSPISSGPNSTGSSTTDTDSDVPTMLGMGPVAGTAPVKQGVVSQPISTAEVSEGDAYWNAQPAAVQALRNMPDGAAKEQLALNLANQGYSIDTQIMVWGWDPQMTMTVRQNQGYSWVPSYGQANIDIGPGLSMPGNSSTYNPGNPPAGAIQVSAAFAIGTIQNPLVQTNSTNS